MISVIMCTFNEKIEFIENAINSILNQSYTNFEYFIVLDNPQNVQIKNVVQKYENKDGRIKIIYNDKNIGLTASLNKALKLVSGNYIARIDADDIAEFNRFEKQLKYIETQKLDIVGSEMRRISEDGVIICERTNKSFPYQYIGRMLEYDNCVPHPSWMVKKEVYDKLNGYRDFVACEDYDFLLRAKRHGFKIGIANSILMNYRISINGISRTNSLRQMLSSCYLQKNLCRIDEVTKGEIEKYLSRYITSTNTEAYEKALQRMLVILDNVKNGDKKQLICLVPLIFKSRFIYLNFKKIFFMYKIKKLYNKEEK